MRYVSTTGQCTGPWTQEHEHQGALGQKQAQNRQDGGQSELFFLSSSLFNYFHSEGIARHLVDLQVDRDVGTKPDKPVLRKPACECLFFLGF